MKALLLDLDDTLLDYTGGVDQSWTEACTACCRPAGIDPAVLVTAIADTRRWFWDDPERQTRERLNMLGAWQHIVEFALERIGQSPAGLAAAVARHFEARRRQTMALFPDALDCLTELRRRGVPLALVTNGDTVQQRDKIERHGLARFFDTILIEGEFPTPRCTGRRYGCWARRRPRRGWSAIISSGTWARRNSSGSAACGWIAGAAGYRRTARCSLTGSSARSTS